MSIEHRPLTNGDLAKLKMEFLSYVWVDGQPSFKIIIPGLLGNPYEVGRYLNHLLDKEEGFYESHIWSFGSKPSVKQTLDHSDDIKNLKDAKAVFSEGKWYVTDAEGIHVSPGFDSLEGTNQEGVYQIKIGPFSGFLAVLDIEAKRVLQRELPARFAEYRSYSK